MNIKSVKRSLALLMVNESPVGLRYLEVMLDNDFLPSIILISNKPKISKMSVETVNNRTNGRFIWKSLNDILNNKDIPVYYTDSHNSQDAIDILKRYSVDLAILGGTEIIKDELLSVPKIGIINVHPGLLPNYRGCSGVEWAIYNNDIVGVSCHFVTKEIDAGAIIVQHALKIKEGDTYEDVRFKAYEAQVESLIMGLKKLSSENFKNNLLKNEGGEYHQHMLADKLTEVKKILDKKIYSHYVK